MGRIILLVLAIAVTIYAIFDWIARSRTWTPGRVNRWVWLAIIVLIPVIGPLSWMITGWVTTAEQAMYGEAPQEESRPSRPDDDPDAISDLADRIARRQKRSRPRPGDTRPSDPHADEGDSNGEDPQPPPSTPSV